MAMIKAKKQANKNPANIVLEVEAHYGLTPGTLRSRKVTKFISSARREAIKRLRGRPMYMSWAEIGVMLRRDHSSVMKLVASKVAVDKPVEKGGNKLGKSKAQPGTTKKRVRIKV